MVKTHNTAHDDANPAHTRSSTTSGPANDRYVANSQSDEAASSSSSNAYNVIEEFDGTRLPYEAILKSLHEGVTIFNRDGLVEEANASAQKILGLTRDQMIGKSFFNSKWETYKRDGSLMEYDEYPVQRALRHGEKPNGVVMGARKPNNKIKWLRVNAEPIRCPSTNEIEYVVSTFHDITDQIETEARLTEALLEARKAVDYSNALAQIDEGVVIYNAVGEVVDFNDAFLDLIGRSIEEADGAGFERLVPIAKHADGRSYTKEESAVFQIINGASSVHGLEAYLEQPDGSRKWITADAVALYNPDTDELDRIFVVFHDVTKQKEHEAQLVEALELANQANRAKTDFLGVISHELRTPMNAVLGFAQNLAHTSLSRQQRRSLAMLEDAGRNMMTLLNDLIDMSALDAGRRRVDRQAISVSQALENAHAVWLQDAEAKGLYLTLSNTDGLSAKRMIDPARFQQIIFNLVSNAIKFTQVGGIHIQTEILPGDMVQIQVIDTGKGVDAADHSRVFDPFEQVDVSMRRQESGLGIGLDVARRLARLMGGDITLDSKVGEGAKFTVTLHAPLAPKPNLNGDQADEAPDVIPIDILCVDDNLKNLHVIATMLRAVGHNVETCSSGDGAVRIASKRRFDVLVLDMVMPDMDGLEVLAEVRKTHSLNAETPVIACTANVLQAQIETYEKAGISGVVPKPIDAANLITTVSSVDFTAKNQAQ